MWEQKNPAREILNQMHDERRLAKTPRPNRHNQPPIVYVLPPYRYFPNHSIYSYGVSSSTVSIAPPPPNVVATEPLPPPAAETGVLRLEVEPRDLLQVFVDGLYVGTPADLGDELELRLGARRSELRARGYRTLIFDTEIVPDRTVIYRGALELAPVASVPAPPAPAPAAPDARVAPVAPAPRVAPEKTKIFLIPGCYMGNVEPDKAALRDGCDISKLVIVTP